MDVNFSNSWSIQEKLDRVITESGYSVTDGDADYLSSNANWAYCPVNICTTRKMP